MKNIFEKSVTDGVINRIENLNSETQPIWGEDECWTNVSSL